MTATQQLLDRYAQADANTVRRGRDWYRAARREVSRIASETGRTRAQVAAVLAITSPDTQLATNIAWTEAACQNGGETAGRYPQAQIPKVRAALNSSRPGRFASGPKVHAFYLAIMGDTDTLVIDRWAAFAAGGTKDRAPLTGERKAYAEAYYSAAATVGETVRDFQAIVWITCRETTPRADGRMVKLTDITN